MLQNWFELMVISYSEKALHWKEGKAIESSVQTHRAQRKTSMAPFHANPKIRM